jgi:hypothetical protein
MIYERDANEEASGRGAGRTHCACPPRKWKGVCRRRPKRLYMEARLERSEVLWSKLRIGK